MAADNKDFPVAYLLYEVGVIVIIVVLALSSFFIFFR
jgi:hypothetical protein